MITSEEVYKIGTITRTHGVKGEVSLAFTDDVWDRVDADYLILDVDGILVPFFMEEYRFRSENTALVKFLDYDTSEAASELCGCAVYFPHRLTPDDAPDEVTWKYFTGFTVEDTKAGELGTIDEVDDSTMNVLFRIGDLLIPAAEPFIKDIDHQRRRITMELPEELLAL
ncbi:MAG: 16S rRNA processing protein RimM [Bacteroidaceae bacterium]|nr:16S rRNA processing protein RimM [Bacteroidaceae bacterium]